MSKEEVIRLKSFTKEQRRHWVRLGEGIVPDSKIIEGWIDACQFARADLMTLIEACDSLTAKNGKLEDKLRRTLLTLAIAEDILKKE